MNFVHGRHNIKTGFETDREYNTNRSTPTGQFQFAGLETGQPGSASTGDAFASFLLGQADITNLSGPSATQQYRNPRFAAFIQDQLRASKKLTLNIGLRYDLPWVTTEKYHNMSGFDPLALNPEAGNLPGAMVFLGNGPGRTSTSVFPFVQADRTLDSKTVIRTDYAIMYTYGNGTAIGYDEGGSPFEACMTNYAANLSSPDNGIHPATTFAQGLPAPAGPLPVVDPGLLNGGGLNLAPTPARSPTFNSGPLGCSATCRRASL